VYSFPCTSTNVRTRNTGEREAQRDE